MRLGKSAREAFLVPTFAPLRASIWAVLGLSAAACGNTVTASTSGSGDGGTGGAGGGGASTVTSSSATGGGGSGAAGGGAAGGGGGGGSETTTSSSSGTTITPSDLCENPTQVLQADGTDSGFVKCADGTIHRDHVQKCNIAVPACQGNEMNILCASDAECSDGPNGKCAHYEGFDLGGATTYCGCAYPCSTDSECQDGTVCVCAGVVPSNNAWPYCATAACTTDKDCPSGECGISAYNDGCGINVELACRAGDDPCRLDAECAEGYQCVTSYITPGEWACQTTNCAIGRPLMVSGQARTAGRTARSDWSDVGLAPDTTTLAADVRGALALTWRDVAALEHASIASFARFSLELLSLGAPPELLAGAQQAATDEIAHAQIAYALASAYAGRALGPSPLDMTGVAPATSRSAITFALVYEACVGETLGAAEARGLAGMVSDPALAATYARIADDEGRHAELGWRTLGWLLRGASDDLRAVAEAAFEKAIADMSVDPRVASDVVAPEHGLLSSSMLGALRRQALTEVVTPCARALLGAPRELAPIVASA